VRLEELTWPDFEAVKGKVRTVLLPVGSVEAHGKHLPLGTDVFAPVEICRRVEELLKRKGIDVLVAPPIWYGHSFSLNVYSGTVNVRASAFRDYVREVMRELADEGFERIVLLNGHGGNVYPLVEAGEELVEERENVEVWLINWWIDFRDEIFRVCDSQGHAGEDETSVILAIRPELVRMDAAEGRKVKYGIRIIKKDMGFEELPGAINDDPKGASAEKGEKILEAVSRRIAGMIAERESVSDSDSASDSNPDSDSEDS